MSYLVFWSVNYQRSKRFLREDRIRCVTAYACDLRKLGSVEVLRCMVRGKFTVIRDPLVFDESTTPPTIQNSTITNVSYWCHRHPRFPQFYISPAGHIRESATDKLVMPAV